jgi:hypothetical protein
MPKGGGTVAFAAFVALVAPAAAGVVERTSRLTGLSVAPDRGGALAGWTQRF